MSFYSSLTFSTIFLTINKKLLKMGITPMTFSTIIVYYFYNLSPIYNLILYIRIATIFLIMNKKVLIMWITPMTFPTIIAYYFFKNLLFMCNQFALRIPRSVSSARQRQRVGLSAPLATQFATQPPTQLAEWVVVGLVGLSRWGVAYFYFFFKSAGWLASQLCCSRSRQKF